MKKLAIHGGEPVRKEDFPAYNTITQVEKDAAQEVMNSGTLSKFLGCYEEDFFGGPKVRAFEKKWAECFGSKHCVSVNSNTSGLFAAVGALGLGPGDEIIVSPYTMTASAICAFVYGAVPVFADICPDTFCLDPESIKKKITPRTKAILVVHIFGQSADMDPIMEMAKENGIAVIEDCAQAPLATYKGRMVGSIGDLGVFSLNYHKHIHTGEGGMVTTNCDELAQRIQLIRNHGETSVEPMGVKDLTNMWGFNYRLTELQAAIGLTQMDRLEDYVGERERNCVYLSDQLKTLPGLKSPWTREGCRHVYYMQAFRYDEDIVGVPRGLFVDALCAELPSAGDRRPEKLVSGGYVAPLYWQPVYQLKQGSQCSFNCPRYEGRVDYSKGLCPVTERMHEKEVLINEYIRPPMTKEDLDQVALAFHKVYEQRQSLL